MKIKTVTTVAGVNPVYFGDYSPRFYWFKNLSDSTLYVSSNPNMIIGGDDVAELPPKSSTSIETTTGVVYVLGAGKVEIHNTDSKFCPFRGVTVVSGGGDSIKSTHFEIVETVDPMTNYTADVYSYIDQDLMVTCGAKSFAAHIAKGLNTVLLGCSDKYGSTRISVNSEDPIIFCNKSSAVDNTLSEYNIIMESTGLMFNYSGRTVTKNYADKAYIAWALREDWFTPIVISTTNDGSTYTMYDRKLSALSPDVATAGGVFDALGTTWYWNTSSPGSYSGATDGSGLNRYRMRDHYRNETEVVVKELLAICMSDYLYN